MEAARELGINPDPNVGGIGANEVPPGVIHIVFPKSRNMLPKGASGLPRTADTIQAVHDRALALFDQFKEGAPAPAMAATGGAGSKSGKSGKSGGEKPK